MTGYWGAGAKRTAETLDDAGWIHTGDLGYLDDEGYLFLGGRAGDLIIRAARTSHRRRSSPPYTSIPTSSRSAWSVCPTRYGANASLPR